MHHFPVESWLLLSVYNPVRPFILVVEVSVLCQVVAYYSIEVFDLSTVLNYSEQPEHQVLCVKDALHKERLNLCQQVCCVIIGLDDR